MRLLRVPCRGRVEGAAVRGRPIGEPRRGKREPHLHGTRPHGRNGRGSGARGLSCRDRRDRPVG
ncbi:hypothetical protein RB2654_14830 [Rhodobacterales bacterium HTCC2654]|uniref:Uncharacterized protein n=1 Tax=Maritimibacter alkaliphilus HTCC2654 TaxID=314271 RepID=A3VH15_9RHOB|nr:hypothetical protein RB2654_14830 [Rhodobacterales bacterium HTCC2654] [Maritimibacter alkaliphilus HTCC2654]